MAVLPDGYLMPLSLVDEVDDGYPIDDLVDHLMLQVDLLLMNSMEMSIDHLEAHEDQDVPIVEEGGMRWSTVMLSTPMMKLLVMIDRWLLRLPGVDDGSQAACALLPCQIRGLIPRFQSQDGSDGVVCPPLSRHPGLHDDCLALSLSLSSVDGYDDCGCCSQRLTVDVLLHTFLRCSLSHDGSSIMTTLTVHRGRMLSQNLIDF